MPLHGEFNYKQLLPAHAHDQYMILLESPTRKTAKLLIETQRCMCAECMKLNCVHDLSSQAIVPVLLSLFGLYILSQLRSSNLENPGHFR